LPRRAPKELKSAGCTPCAMRYFPAGPSLGMEPAGEMWSVVTESPSSARVHHVVEVGRLLDVGGGRVPLVDTPRGNRQALPVLVAIEDVGVFVLEHAAIDGGAHSGGHLFIGGPDVAQEYRLAYLAQTGYALDSGKRSGIGLVGRSPWTAADALVRLLAGRPGGRARAPPPTWRHRRGLPESST